MANIDVFNTKNEKVGTLALEDAVFGTKVNTPLVLQVIKAQLAGQRQGTASTKTKGEVRGGGKKPFKQKGTGNSRQGSTRSPLMPGGGSTFGPRPRKYNQNTPKEMVKGALRSVLSDKFAAKRLIIIDKFDMKAAKTKEASKIINDNFKANKALVVDTNNKTMGFATRNLENANYLDVSKINVYDMVKYEWLFISKDSVKAITERLA